MADGIGDVCCVQDVVLYDYSAPAWAKMAATGAATEILRMALDSPEDAFKRLHDHRP